MFAYAPRTRMLGELSMNRTLITLLITMLAVAVTSYGCTSKSDEYVVYAPRDHAVYKISRRGAFFRDENFDVVLVYGFNDNRSVAQEMVESLNREEPNTYFFSEVE